MIDEYRDSYVLADAILRDWSKAERLFRDMKRESRRARANAVAEGKRV